MEHPLRMWTFIQREFINTFSLVVYENAFEFRNIRATPSYSSRDNNGDAGRTQDSVYIDQNNTYNMNMSYLETCLFCLWIKYLELT